MKLMKRLWLLFLAGAALFACAACSNGEDDDDEEVDVTPTVNESDCITLTTTVPTNATRLYINRKRVSETSYAQIYDKDVTSGEKVTVIDYFVDKGVDYNYKFSVRFADGTFKATNPITKSAVDGYGELALTGGKATWHDESGILTYDELPTVSCSALPNGMSMKIHLAVDGKSSGIFLSATAGSGLNLKAKFMGNDNYTGVSLSIGWVAVLTFSDASRGTWASPTFIGSDYGLPDSVTLSDEALSAALADGLPSFAIAIPAGTKYVAIYRKGGSATSYSQVSLVSSASGTTFAAETPCTFVDSFVAPGSSYSYYYIVIDGDEAATFTSTATETLTPTAGIGELKLEGGSTSYNSATGVLSVAELPTVSPNTADDFTLSVRLGLRNSTADIIKKGITEAKDVNFYTAVDAKYRGTTATPFWQVRATRTNTDTKETWFGYPLRCTGSSYGLPASITIPASVAE